MALSAILSLGCKRNKFLAVPPYYQNKGHILAVVVL